MLAALATSRLAATRPPILATSNLRSAIVEGGEIVGMTKATGPASSRAAALPRSQFAVVVWRIAAICILVPGLLVVSAIAATADMGLKSSDPREGSQQERPVEKITLIFAGTGEIGRSGVQIVNSEGQAIPATVASDDNITHTFTPSSPLQTGQYGVKWSFIGGDGHPMSGVIRFDVSAATSGQPASPAASPIPAAAGDTEQALGLLDSSSADGSTSAPMPQDLTFAFAEAPEPPVLPGVISTVGRWLAISGSLLAVGGLIFARTVLVGRRPEINVFFRYIRICGALIMLGAGVQIVATMLGGASLSALAIVLALIGGWFILDGAMPSSVEPPPHYDDGNGTDLSELNRPLGGGTATLTKPAPTHTVTRFPKLYADLRRSRLAVMGAVLVVLAFLFDGHTSSMEPRWLMVLASVAHTLAVSIWVGGIASLVLVLARRTKRHEPLAATELAFRFSVMAGAAAAMAGAAGLVMTWLILDSPSQLWSSSWGLLLLAKLGLVGAVAAIAAHNHFRVLPQLDDRTWKSSAALRKTAASECGVLVLIIGVTAWLVVSGTGG